jgi:hypothetical protein
MQPLSIDNPRPHQRRYAIATTTATTRVLVPSPAPSQAAGTDDDDSHHFLAFLSINSSNLYAPIAFDPLLLFLFLLFLPLAYQSHYDSFDTAGSFDLSRRSRARLLQSSRYCLKLSA